MDFHPLSDHRCDPSSSFSRFLRGKYANSRTYGAAIGVLLSVIWISSSVNGNLYCPSENRTGDRKSFAIPRFQTFSA